MNQQTFNNGEYTWIQADSRDADSVAVLQETYGLSDKVLTYTLDRHERARVEYVSADDTFLLIYNAPHTEKYANHFETSPVAFVIKEKHFFSFTTDRTAYVIPMIQALLKQTDKQTHYQLLFHVLFQIADAFFPVVEEITTDRIHLNEKLRRRTTNKNILELSDLSIGIVYLVTATKQNAVLLEQLKALDVYHQLTEEDKDQLNDALIEAKQAMEMTQLSSQVLEQLASTYNNLLNNNLNDTMKFLTVWSLLLTIPTIVTGFYGMNMKLPFAESEFAWIIALIISVLLSVWMVIALWRRIR